MTEGRNNKKLNKLKEDKDMFNQARTFGVEVEFFGVSRTLVGQALRAQGVNAQVEGYNHTDKAYWKIITDSSVDGEGNELVSPPLSGDKGLAELQTVLKVLNEIGAKVNKSCGIHVHHDANDFTPATFKNVYGIYGKYEATIDELFPASRRGNSNRFCGQLNNDSLYFDALARIKTLADVGYMFRNRYKKVNFQSYRIHGTIEFRQHAGSTDFDKISSWIILTQAIVERAVSMGNKTIQLKREDACTTWNNFKVMLRMTKSYGADELQLNALNILTKRRKELARVA